MSLSEVLSQCQVRIEQYDKFESKIGETNTKSTIIEPILASLGWDVLDLEEVHREYRYRSGGNPVDYALMLSRTPKLFVEAKGYGENLNDMKWADQTISYATTAGVDWVVLTDGVTWKLFNAHAPGSTEKKLLRSVSLRDGVEVLADVLQLLSKENMRGDRLAEMWRGLFVDRRVKECLLEIFNTGDVPDTIVNLLNGKVSDVSRSEIRASLSRARVAFDFPAVATEFLPESGATTVRKARVQSSTSLVDIAHNGRLVVGSVLQGTFKGVVYKASFDGHNVVPENGIACDSLSKAMKEATGTGGNGWTFWRAVDNIVGDLVTLSEMQSRVDVNVS